MERSYHGAGVLVGLYILLASLSAAGALWADGQYTLNLKQNQSAQEIYWGQRAIEQVTFVWHWFKGTSSAQPDHPTGNFVAKFCGENSSSSFARWTCQQVMGILYEISFGLAELVCEAVRDRASCMRIAVVFCVVVSSRDF